MSVYYYVSLRKTMRFFHYHWFVRKRYLIGAALFFITVFASIGMLAYSQLYKQRQAMDSALNISLSAQVASAMHLWVGEQVIQAKILANDMTVRRYCERPSDAALRAEAEKILRQTHGLQHYLAFIAILNMRPDGRSLTLPGVNGEFTHVYPGEFMLDSVGGRGIGFGGASLSYSRAMAEGKSAFVSEAKASSVPGFPHLFMVMVPVKNEREETVAGLGFAVKLEYFTRMFVSDFMLGKTGQLEILDDRGQFLGSLHERQTRNPDSAQKGRALLPHLSKKDGVTFQTDFDGKRFDYAATPVPLPHAAASTWWVLFRRAGSELHQELAFSRNMFALFCAGGAGLSIFLAFAVRSVASRKLVVERARRRQLYVDSAPAGMLTAGPHGRIVNVNPAACAIFGYTKNELLHLRIADLFPGAALAGAILSCAGIEMQGRRKDGGSLAAVCVVRPLEGGRRLYFIRDETELLAVRRAREELTAHLAASLKESEVLREKAEAADRAKSVFLSNMSHEIRTPMNAITGFLQLLKRTPHDARQADYLEKMNAASRSLLGLVDNILDFTALESGFVVVEDRPFSPAEALEGVRREFAAAAAVKGLSLSLDMGPGVPPNLRGDSNAFTRILGNFMSNAVKFTREGGIRISCRLAGRTEKKARLCVTVSDTGIGIEEQVREKLFQRFSQAGGSSTRAYGGAGLGLALSEKLARAMGGEIRLESKAGVGTSISLFCPFALPDAPGAQGASALQ